MKSETVADSYRVPIGAKGKAYDLKSVKYVNIINPREYN